MWNTQSLIFDKIIKPKQCRCFHFANFAIESGVFWFISNRLNLPEVVCSPQGKIVFTHNTRKLKLLFYYPVCFVITQLKSDPDTKEKLSDYVKFKRTRAS